jgi:hypothetical protein
VFIISSIAGSILHGSSFQVSFNTLLKILLLVGKLHEILLIGSMAAIGVYYMRWKLVTGPGLPLGMVSATGQQLSYFVSREFKRTMLQEKKVAFSLVSTAILDVLVSSFSRIHDSVLTNTLKLGSSSNALIQPSLTVRTSTESSFYGLGNLAIWQFVSYHSDWSKDHLNMFYRFS